MAAVPSVSDPATAAGTSSTSVANFLEENAERRAGLAAQPLGDRPNGKAFFFYKENPEQVLFKLQLSFDSFCIFALARLQGCL